MSPAQQLAHWQQTLETIPTPPNQKRRNEEEIRQKPPNWNQMTPQQKKTWSKNKKRKES